MRSTFALLENCIFRLKAAASLLSVSENSLRTYLKDSEIDIQRANTKNPGSPAVRLFEIGDIFEIAQWRRKQDLVKKIVNGPVVVAVDVVKGGTGKSTTTAELGVQLSLEGYRVLLIDLDVQASLTQLMGYESDFTMDEAKENGLSEAAIIDGTFAQICLQYIDSKNGRGTKLSDVTSVIKKPFGQYGPSLIPADTFLGDLEQSFVFAKGNRELVFRGLLKDSSEGQIPGMNINEYDFVIFDCPPSISFVSTNAIAAADIVVAPIKMDSFGVKGLSRLISEINGLSSRSSDVRPELIILPTHYSTNISRVARMQQRLQGYKNNLCPAVISTSEMFPKFQENYLPLTLQMPTSAPVAEYRMFTEYLLSKCFKNDASRVKSTLGN